MISAKQMKILAFPYSKYDAIICDGSVRSGKTSIMTVSFVRWAMENFDNRLFGLCGKTVDSCVKNLVNPFLSLHYARERYALKWRRSEKVLEIRQGSVVNFFEVFGGKDEGSAALIQGRTLAGVLLDEVALMPQSFVQQALTRCSVEGSKLWFSCNPEGVNHWFYKDWIQKAKEKNVLYLHFTMRDNPSLSEETLKKYETYYSGVFYRRYVLGEWCVAEGLIYPEYSGAFEDPFQKSWQEYALSIDYGTQNAFAALLWGRDGKTWHIFREYRYSGRDERKQKTDSDYVADMEQFTKDIPDEILTYIDPSATSFIAALKRSKRGFRTRHADNAVNDGIRDVSVCMQNGTIRFFNTCTELKKEFEGYVWINEEGKEERPQKVNDHLMDAMRYFVRSKRLAKPIEEYRSPFGG